MKATDLMIGGWVDCPESTRKERTYAQVEAIEEYHSILVKKENANWFLDIDELKPIPLTAEILEKNFPEEDTTVKWYVGRGSSILVHVWGDKSLFRGIVKHVHQLQHALKLCGIEKTIEL